MRESLYSKVKTLLPDIKPEHVVMARERDGSFRYWPQTCYFGSCLRAPRVALGIEISDEEDSSGRVTVYLCEQHVPAAAKKSRAYRLMSFATRAKSAFPEESFLLRMQNLTKLIEKMAKEKMKESERRGE